MEKTWIAIGPGNMPVGAQEVKGVRMKSFCHEGNSETWKIRRPRACCKNYSWAFVMK